LRAREIAHQVLDPDHRKRTVPCEPASDRAFDQQCADVVIRKYGRLLFRRPLRPDELQSVMAVVRTSADELKDFYQGLQFGLARLLVSPNFVFLQETGEADPERPGVGRLDAYSLAARLSFLLWNATPDDELLAVAENGTLHDSAVLAREVDRMIASPRLEGGVRAFFSDMLGFNRFAGLIKDQEVFPKYSSTLRTDAQEQTLRTIVELLVHEKGDYRDLFTTRQTFLTRTLGALYRVPVSDVAFDGWMPYTFAEHDRRAGILTQAGFLVLDVSHPGRSSPTIRGKAVRELLLCQPVPAPPANVNFTIVQDTSNPNYRTARERLTAHRTAPTCAGCHAIMDPVGLAMETYDGIGSTRSSENGAAIGTSGTFDGKPYTDLVNFERILHDDPALSACLVQRVFAYGTGRMAERGEGEWLQYAEQRFDDDHARFVDLLRSIATSKAFHTISIQSVNPPQLRVDGGDMRAVKS
jgi:Protein of unknown function (DUF1592)/Protein of unknown function (DUF1588)/Protein of unknown function (DUF1595)/Protein of unknown function (DUF1585)